MRALSAFQRLSSALGTTVTDRVTSALAGTGACRLRGVTTGSPAQQGKPETIPDAFDQEFDRGDDEATGIVREAQYEAMLAARREAGLKVPVDLETEFDRDDPEAVDPRELYAETEIVPPPEVDLDTEFDRDDPLLADKSHLWDEAEPPCPADIDVELDRFGGEEMEKDATIMERKGPAGPADLGAQENPAGTLAGNTPFGQEGKRTA